MRLSPETTESLFWVWLVLATTSLSFEFFWGAIIATVLYAFLLLFGQSS
jgi:hypothetical protein